MARSEPLRSSIAPTRIKSRRSSGGTTSVVFTTLPHCFRQPQRTNRRLPGNSQDWIAISRAGQADNQYVSYRYLGGATEGTWSLKSGPPGDYEVRVYLNWPAGGYNPVLRQPIKVVSPEEGADAGLINKPKVRLASRTFAPGQPIEVRVTGFPGNSQDWVAIAKAGSPDSTYKDYDYTGGVNEGTWTYTMNEPGEYEIRIYLNWPTGGYNPLLREKISVTAPR